MKRIIYILLAIALILCACGKEPEVETIATATAAESTETTISTEPATLPPTEATEATQAPTLPPETTAPTEAPEPEGRVGIVTSRRLNVREEPSINAKKIAELSHGAEVLVLEEQQAGGMNWGRIQDGWICLTYVRWIESEDAAPLEPKPVPQDNSPAETVPSPTHEATIPQRPVETQPAQTEPPATEAATEPAHEQTETAPATPAVCQHQWVPIQNIPAEYSYRYFVVCSCGAAFADADEWAAHRDGYLGTEDLVNHTGYASSSEKAETSPSMTVWQCSQCGVSKTINSLENP